MNVVDFIELKLPICEASCELFRYGITSFNPSSSPTIKAILPPEFFTFLFSGFVVVLLISSSVVSVNVTSLGRIVGLSDACFTI